MLNPEKYIEWLNLSGRAAFILLVISSVLLFGGDTLIDRLGLLNARESVKSWIGIAWLLSISISISVVGSHLYKWISRKVEIKSSLNLLQKRLHNLTPDEKAFLRFYISNKTRTQSAAYSDGMVNGLVAEKIIFRPSQMAHYYNVFSYNIQPWAFEYLQEHPECL